MIYDPNADLTWLRDQNVNGASGARFTLPSPPVDQRSLGEANREKPNEGCLERRFD